MCYLISKFTVGPEICVFSSSICSEDSTSLHLGTLVCKLKLDKLKLTIVSLHCYKLSELRHMAGFPQPTAYYCLFIMFPNSSNGEKYFFPNLHLLALWKLEEKYLWAFTLIQRVLYIQFQNLLHS